MISCSNLSLHICMGSITYIHMHMKKRIGASKAMATYNVPFVRPILAGRKIMSSPRIVHLIQRIGAGHIARTISRSEINTQKSSPKPPPRCDRTRRRIRFPPAPCVRYLVQRGQRSSTPSPPPGSSYTLPKKAASLS